MRIVFITSKLNFTRSGGSVEEIDLMIRILQSLGHQVTAITAFSSANDIPASVPYRVITEYIGSGGLIHLQKQVWNLLKKYEPLADVFQVDGHLFMYGAGLYRMRGGRIPVVAFMNQFLTCWPQYISSLFPQSAVSFLTRLKKRLRWLIERTIGVYLANQVDRFAFVSPHLRAMYEGFGIRRGELVVGDPIDWKKIRRENQVNPDSYQKRLKTDGKIFLFYSSRMSPGKGFDIFLQAFSLVENKDRFRVVLGGAGPEAAAVREMRDRLGLAPYVELPGWVTKAQLYQYYKEADVFIQADWWPAGTSISLIYALAFGVPAILPGGGGLAWNAKGGALYFPYRDCPALARAIEQMGSDPLLRAKLSRGGNERLAEDEMNYQLQINKLAQVMQELAGKSPAPVVATGARYQQRVSDWLISGVQSARYALTEPVKLRIARWRFGHRYRKPELNPLVSIAMATYQRGQLLMERTIPSWLNQIYQNFEVILVGDRRVDNTEELIRKLGDPRIRFVHLPEYTRYPPDMKSRWCVGGAPAHNLALRLARGLWIADGDDDDVFTPNHLASLLRFAQQGDYEFVSAVYIAEKFGEPVIIDVKNELPRIGGVGTWFYRSYLKLFPYNVHSWRKSYNRPRDIDRQLRMYRAGVRMGFLDEVVTRVLPLPGLHTVGLAAREEQYGIKLR